MINASAAVWAEGAPTLQEVMPAEGVFSLIWLLIALPLLGATRANSDRQSYSASQLIRFR